MTYEPPEALLDSPVYVSESAGRGFGLFAARPLPPLTPVALYPGTVKRAEAIFSNAEDAGGLSRGVLLRKLEYLQSLLPLPGSSCPPSVLDPTCDATGDICRQFSCTGNGDNGEEAERGGEEGGEEQGMGNATAWTCGGIYVNEPTMHEHVNCLFAYNLSVRRRLAGSEGEWAGLELWTSSHVEKGEELLTFYGTGYNREYLIDSTLLCGIRNLSICVEREEGERKGAVRGIGVAGTAWRVNGQAASLARGEEVLDHLDCLAECDGSQHSPRPLLRHAVAAAGDALWALEDEEKE